MDSCAWMNGQYRQVGPPSQSSQAATQLNHDSMWNQQTRSAHNSCQYMILNRGVRPPQGAHFTFSNGAYSNKQLSNCQTSTVPHQAVSSQQPAGQTTNAPYVKALHGNLQNSFTNAQSGKPLNSGFINSLNQSPPNLMKASNSHRQQDMSAHWNQQGAVHWKQSKRTQDATSYCTHLKSLLQNRAESTKPVSAYATTATTLPHEKGACSNTLVSTSAHNRQAAHDQNHRQIGTQRRFPPSIPPPSYSAAVSHISSMTQKTQPYPIHINSTHNREDATRRFLSETNEFPAADTEEQMVSRQIIARIAEDLQSSFTARSDGHSAAFTSSTYRGNSNAHQSLPLSSGLPPSLHSLPKATHGVLSRTQHSVDVPPHQRSAPHAFYVSATGDGSGNVFFPESNSVSKGNTTGSLSDASQLMKVPENISPQINKTVPSVANNSEMHEIFEKVSTVKANDSTIHTSPGRTGMRAVAVVQPLSQECYQVASKNTSSNTISQSAESTALDESLSHPEKLFISPAVDKTKKDLYLREEFNPYPENPNQMMSNKCVISNSAAANSGTTMSSDSAGQQGLSQKQFCADDTGSELAINMQVDQRVSPTAQQSVTSEVPASQSGDEDKSENPTELSAVPTFPWTAATLNATLIKPLQDTEKAEMKLKRNLTMCDSSRQILSLFWDDERSLLRKLREGWYRNLINDMTEFLKEHVTSDTVILSQVKYAKQLKNYYVLKDDKVYSEVPYRSSWLNVNEQLDDIDKEFGFPWSLKHRLHILENHSQPDQVERVNSTPAQSVSEALNNSLSQTELGHVESGKEKQASTVEAISTQATSPNEPESADPSDPYSFEIQVFPPEEAKRIFEQAQSKMPQTTDTDSLPGEVMNSSVQGELPEATDVTLNDSELESESVCPITQICCITRWKEIICGSNTPSLSKCQCKNEQSLQDCTDKTLVKDEMAVDQELCRKLSQTIASTENDHKSHSHSDSKTENISKMSRNSSPPYIIVISEDEDLSSSGTEIQLDPEKGCIQGHLKSTGSMQSCTSVSSDKEIENLPTSEIEVASQMSDLEETCRQSQWTSADVAKSSLETEEEQTQISARTALHTTFSHRSKQECVERKRKRECSSNRFFPLFKKANKCSPRVKVDSQPSTCRRLSSDATDSEPLATNPRAVQLVLFGSVPQDKCVLIGNRKSHKSFPGAVSGVSRPPEVLSVKLSPFKRKSSETVQTGEHSVKQLIHEKWRRSFPPTKIRDRSKLKTQRHTVASLSGASFKKAEIVDPTNNKKPSISNKMRKWNQNTTRCLSVKRRRALSDRLKHGEVRKDAVTLQQPADEERSTAENESCTVTPLQENSVLRFSVLPNTFTLMDQDGSNKIKEMEGPVPDKPALEEKDKTSNKTITKEIGTWYPNPEKVCPLRSSPTLKTSSIFHQFQKKYMEKTQPSMDE